MLQTIYNELLELDLKYYELAELAEDRIYIVANSFDLEGVDEVMHIKEAADKYYWKTKWDGQKIEIIKNRL